MGFAISEITALPQTVSLFSKGSCHGERWEVGAMRWEEGIYLAPQSK